MPSEAAIEAEPDALGELTSSDGHCPVSPAVTLATGPDALGEAPVDAAALGLVAPPLVVAPPPPGWHATSAPASAMTARILFILFPLEAMMLSRRIVRTARRGTG